MRLLVLSASLVAMLVGCGKSATHSSTAIWKPGQTSPAQSNTTAKASPPIVTPSNAAFGKVVSVNQKAGYAVLGYAIGALPPIDSRVYAYRNGLKVGELRVSGPQKENNIIADLVQGECRAGDDVKGE